MAANFEKLVSSHVGFRGYESRVYSSPLAADTGEVGRLFLYYLAYLEQTWSKHGQDMTDRRLSLSMDLDRLSNCLGECHGQCVPFVFR